MEFIEDLYFNYIQELSTEKREELLSVLDRFFGQEEGHFSSKFHTYTLVEEDEDIKQIITKEYASQYALDCEHFNIELTEMLDMLSSAKYWLLFEYFKVQGYTNLKQLKEDMSKAEEIAVQEYAKFYKAWKDTPKKGKKNSKVIDFNKWRKKLDNERTV